MYDAEEADMENTDEAAGNEDTPEDKVVENHEDSGKEGAGAYEEIA